MHLKDSEKANTESMNKDRELQLKKANADAAKRYCRTCKREIYPSFNCGCAGGGPSGGGGGGGGGGGDNSDASPKQSGMSAQQMPTHTNAGMNLQLDVRRPVLTPKATMLLIIADLLSKNLLSINDNNGLCTLIIICDPKLLSDLQRNAVNDFANEIKKELEEFKANNKLCDKDCIVKTETDNQGNIISLSINIPDPKLYTKFIDQLMVKELLSNKFISPQDTQKDNKNAALSKKFNPSPFSTELKPKCFKE